MRSRPPSRSRRSRPLSWSCWPFSSWPVASRSGDSIPSGRTSRWRPRSRDAAAGHRTSPVQTQESPMNNVDLKSRRAAALATPNRLGADATRDLSGALNILLADVFALYIKTKNFHWHVSGPHFRDYHLLLDEQGEQIFAMRDPIAERARKIGGTSLRSIGDISRRQRILDNDADYVDPQDMLAELREDNKSLTATLRQVHNVCDE